MWELAGPKGESNWYLAVAYGDIRCHINIDSYMIQLKTTLYTFFFGGPLFILGHSFGNNHLVGSEGHEM